MLDLKNILKNVVSGKNLTDKEKGITVRKKLKKGRGSITLTDHEDKSGTYEITEEMICKANRKLRTLMKKRQQELKKVAAE